MPRNSLKKLAPLLEWHNLVSTNTKQNPACGILFFNPG
jgi:hypothetical protein